MTDEIIAFKGELWLLSWRESHNNGATVTFQVDSDELEPFKRMTIKKGKRAGQRFMCVLVEIAEDEQPVKQEPEKKGGPLSKSAAQMCENTAFHRFLMANYSGYWFQSWNIPGRPCNANETAAEVLRMLCNVKSRAELDHNQEAARSFHDIMKRFNAWKPA